MDCIKTVVVCERIGRGEVIVPDLLGLGADLISTSDILIRQQIKATL